MHKKYILLFLFLSTFLLTSLFCFNLTEDKTYCANAKDTSKKNKIEPIPKQTPPINKENEVIVDLKNPTYSNGILTTHEGGVITTKDIRIQARTIQYIKKNEDGKLIHRLEADGDLMLQYKNKAFVGEELEYDFVTKKGRLFEAKIFASPWYISGNYIDLNPDGSYSVNNVYVTTCIDKDSAWNIHAKTVTVTEKDLFDAKKVRFRLFKVPIFWLPSFKVNLQKFFSTPLINYDLTWDKGVGPRVSLRYQLYSWKDFAIYVRGDCRLTRGLGGAIETEYKPENINLNFVTKNYIATDVLPNDPKRKQRYRLQGNFDYTTDNNKTKTNITWDKYSDINMPSDFNDNDFELNTPIKTELNISHKEKNLIGSLNVRPKFNSFESIAQNLPSAFLSMRPLKIPYLGIIFSNWSKIGYSDYTYAKNFSSYLHNTHSIRLETNHNIYRPFNFKALTITPMIGLIGIYYDNLPHGINKHCLGILKYGGEIKTLFYKHFENYKHIVQPYINYEGYTTPTIRIDDHYVFSSQDGYSRLNFLRGGIKNLVFPLDKTGNFPSLEVDIYANAFLGSNEIKLSIPKLYLDLSTHLSSVSFIWKNVWNIWHNLLDQSITRVGWTANENLAMSLEFRYRSKYYWRKADHNSLFFDAKRKEKESLLSPLSDRRNTVLTNIFFRINPYWTCHIQSHHGWHRAKEKGYNEYKIDVSRIISTSWKLYISYQHTQTDDRFNLSLSLMKNQKEISLF